MSDAMGCASRKQPHSPMCNPLFRGNRNIGILRFLLLFFVASTLIAPKLLDAETKGKPKVRAITAFIEVDVAHYQEQVAAALKILRQAKAAMETAGYEVQTIRITTQPFPRYIQGLSQQEAKAFFKAYDALATKESFNANIGPAMLKDSDDPASAELLGEVLSTAKSINASLIVAAEDGIHWKAVQAAARVMKYLEEHSENSQGNFSFAATAMLTPYGPFYPGSYHTGRGREFSIGLESANLVEEVFSATPFTGDNAPLAVQRLSAALTQHALAIEAIARAVEKQTGWTYMGLDPTPAPLGDVSIGAAIEKFTGSKFGSSGTLLAASVITQAVKSVPVKQVGYSGLMLPVLEDRRLAQRWSEGTYDIDSLLAYSSVCGTGLDTVPLPGDVSQEQLARIIGDIASLAFKWHKPLTARLQPARGKKVGEQTEFKDQFLTNATIRPLP